MDDYPHRGRGGGWGMMVGENRRDREGLRGDPGEVGERHGVREVDVFQGKRRVQSP